MAEVFMKVTLLAYTKLSEDFLVFLFGEYAEGDKPLPVYGDASDGQLVSLTAIRTCYSHLAPTDIIKTEGERYFGSEASDDNGGTEADRLIRQIISSGHTSTMEHLNFTFALMGVSRALLAQLTRHRHASFSVQSQRYVRMGSEDKSGGFDYVVPTKVAAKPGALETFEAAMNLAQTMYDELRAKGVPPEDARAVLPNAAACNLTMTMNFRTLLDFYGKRRKGRGAQQEITELAEELKEAVVAVEPWTRRFFDKA